jgi:2-polyprenyl-3-methyl-5-hydroxy-6-metoxy-1,4-benzoquinol methylase
MARLVLQRHNSVVQRCVTPLRYTPLERVVLPRPADRVAWVAEQCRGKAVLDLGCLDETALVKEGTQHWLHGRIAQSARCVTGIDSSSKLPREGVITGPRSRIIHGDVNALDGETMRALDVDVIVAGELIEHLPDTGHFLRQLKALFPGRELIATTPNATSLANVILAALSRESAHEDHLQIYSYKTLHTQCLRARFESWTILPYHVRFTEMILRSRGIKRSLLQASERVINAAEYCAPMLSGGLILHVTEI